MSLLQTAAGGSHASNVPIDAVSRVDPRQTFHLEEPSWAGCGLTTPKPPWHSTWNAASGTLGFWLPAHLRMSSPQLPVVCLTHECTLEMSIEAELKEVPVACMLYSQFFFCTSEVSIEVGARSCTQTTTSPLQSLPLWAMYRAIHPRPVPPHGTTGVDGTTA